MKKIYIKMDKNNVRKLNNFQQNDIIFKNYEKKYDKLLIIKATNENEYDDIINIMEEKEIEYFYDQYDDYKNIKLGYKEFYYKKTNNKIKFDNDAKSIVLICDKNFIMPTYVTLNSFKNNANIKINFYIICVNCIEEFILNKPEIEINNYIELIDVKDFGIEIDVWKNRVTSAGIHKFIIPDMLNNCENALYVDSDIICLDDISDIFNENLDDIYACVVEDKIGEIEHKENERINRFRYFNSGFIYLNLKKMREDEISEKLYIKKITDKNIKYMDQDVFNIIMGDKIKYISYYYNFMTSNFRMSNDQFKKSFPKFDVDKIKNIHYCSDKPWIKNNVYFAQFWHNEYEKIYRKAEKEKIKIGNNSVLIVEAADCHAEIMPGIVMYLHKCKYDIDILFTRSNFNMDPLSYFKKNNIRIMCEDVKFFDTILNENILNKYKFIIFTSRHLYYSIDGIRYPSIYKYFPILNEYKNKIISIEHRLELIDDEKDDKYMILANPQNIYKLNDKIVNLPMYGDIIIKKYRRNIITFIVAGSIEKKRKNFQLLVDTVLKINHYKFKIYVLGRNVSYNIPDVIKDKIIFIKNPSYYKLYKFVNNADYILPLFDYEIIEHQRYLSDGTSGTYQLIYGFRKPCIIQKKFAENNFLDERNSLIYEDNSYFYKSMIEAINLSNERYSELVKNLQNIYDKIILRSTYNFNKLIESIKQEESY